MALGRRKRGPVQGELFVTSADLPRSAGHPFYDKLNKLPESAKFDEYVEESCRPAYAEFVGRPGIAPGVYFRMLFVGYFEGLGSQRGIAWKCAGSLSLRSFLGMAPAEGTPDRSSMTRTRARLGEGIHESVFAWVLGLCAAKKPLADPKAVAVDSTTLEANAALKSIVRKGAGEDYKTYLRGLMRAEGVADPSDEDPTKFDRKRKGKKLPNDEWESKTDPDSRIMRVEDKTTHLGYKAEDVVDLKSDVIVAAEVYFGDESDTQTCVESVMAARTHLDRIELPDAAAKAKLRIEEAAMDKGYHGRETLARASEYSIRTYAAVPDRPHRSKWGDAPAGSSLREPPADRRGTGQGPAAEAVGVRRADLRPHLRDRRSAADLAPGFGERPQAVPDDGGGEESGHPDAVPARGRHAQTVARRPLGRTKSEVRSRGRPRAPVLAPVGDLEGPDRCLAAGGEIRRRGIYPGRGAGVTAEKGLIQRAVKRSLLLCHS